MSFVPAVGPADGRSRVGGMLPAGAPARARGWFRRERRATHARRLSPEVAPGYSAALGTHDGIPCLAAGLDAAPAALPPGYRFVHLRELFGVLPDEQFAIATAPRTWRSGDLAHRYCGRCGKPLALKSDERARACLACGQLYYPQISPAVIVAVCRE